MSAKTRHRSALLLALGTSALLTACASRQPSLEDAKKYNTPPKQEHAAPPVAPSEPPPQQ
jgi:outer membrane biogenesis lipoprotein LolB